MRPTTAVATAIFVGGLVRLAPVIAADFPLNDGGMFYAMIGDLQRAGFHLPETTSYNASGIPFSYPPLAFYVGALLSRLTPLDALGVLRFLPLVVSTATIGAFYLLARSLLSSRSERVVATFVFALLPRISAWMIMGGGLTRSFGLLFLILALHQLHEAYTTHRLRPLLGSMLFGGLTLMSHMEMSWLLFWSSLVFFCAFGRNRDGAVRSILAGAGALVVASPWWVAVVARDGVSPFLGAGGSRSAHILVPLFQMATLNVTNETLLPILSLVGLGGLVICLTDRRLTLPAWFAVAAIIEPWALTTAIAVPLALLAGIGFARGVTPLVRALAGEQRPVLGRSLPFVALGVMTTYVAVAGLIAPLATTTALSGEERSAMAWASANLPSTSRVLLITAEPWWQDRSSEWFPVLSRRISIATPQGLEWLPHGRFAQVLSAHEKAQNCAARDAGCLTQWSASSGMDYTDVYISKAVPVSLEKLNYADCCAALRASLYADSGYRVVYDGSGATIFALRAP